MTKTLTKPVVEADLPAQLEQAESDESAARLAHERSAGRAVLGELSADAVADASKAWQAAQSRVAAIKSAQSLLAQRKAEQDAHEEQERVKRLRQESEAAHVAQMNALTSLADTATTLTGHLETVRAQGSVLNAIHAQLVESDRAGWDQVEQDRRDAEATIGSRFAQRRAEVREAVQRERYGLQHSDGGTHVLDAPLVVMGTEIAPEGLSHADAMPRLLEYELKALTAIDKEEQAIREDAWHDHAARALVAGFGHLSASGAEVRDAASLDAATVGLLLPRDTKAALAGLGQFLPTSSHQGIAVRSVPRSAIEAKAEEGRLDAGLDALARLTN